MEGTANEELGLSGSWPADEDLGSVARRDSFGPVFRIDPPFLFRDVSWRHVAKLSHRCDTRAVDAEGDMRAVDPEPHFGPTRPGRSLCRS